MRVLVCGGRDYADRLAAFTALDHLHQQRGITRIIHGAARGADTLALEWCNARFIPAEAFPVTLEDWKEHGGAAGPRRNRIMLVEGQPQGVVAFPGGRGTADMVRQATAAGLKVWRPYG